MEDVIGSGGVIKTCWFVAAAVVGMLKYIVHHCMVGGGRPARDKCLMNTAHIG